MGSEMCIRDRYDNEWGYSNRVVEVAVKIGQLIDDKAMVKAI